MIPLRRVLPLLAVAAAAVLSWWLYRQVGQSRPPVDAGPRHEPDAVIDAFDLSGYDATGRLQHRLLAERVRHYPDDDSSVVDAPYLELYPTDAPPWTVRAQRGDISAEGTQVLLQGTVHLRRSGPGVRTADIRTERLLAFPEREYAETDIAISYRSDGLQVDAVGMRAHLAEGRVELLSQVRAQHQPTGTR